MLNRSFSGFDPKATYKARGRWGPQSGTRQPVPGPALRQLQYVRWLVSELFADHHRELERAVRPAINRPGWRWHRPRVQDRWPSVQRLDPGLLQCIRPTNTADWNLRLRSRCCSRSSVRIRTDVAGISI